MRARTKSDLDRYLEGRERVLGRGHRSWLAARLVEACHGDARLVATVLEEARR
jgi:hypothetical protein